MRLIVFIVGLLISFPVLAEEKSPLAEMLDSMPPMNAVDREAFDKAARSVYREDCNCLAFLVDGKPTGFKLPLTDSDRRLLIEGFKHKILIPLSQSGQTY